ncbi:hypothetical protein ACOSP7_002592 [Xanthoceras sorbifolium]
MVLRNQLQYWKAVGQRQNRENYDGSNQKRREGRGEEQPSVMVSGPLNLHATVHQFILHGNGVEQPAVEVNSLLPSPSVTVNKTTNKDEILVVADNVEGCAQQGLSSLEFIASGRSREEANKLVGKGSSGFKAVVRAISSTSRSLEMPKNDNVWVEAGSGEMPNVLEGGFEEGHSPP